MREWRSGRKSLAQYLAQSSNWGWILIPVASSANSMGPTSAFWPAVHSGCLVLCGPHLGIHWDNPIPPDYRTAHCPRGSEGLHLSPAAVTALPTLTPWGSDLTWALCVQAQGDIPLSPWFYEKHPIFALCREHGSVQAKKQDHKIPVLPKLLVLTETHRGVSGAGKESAFPAPQPEPPHFLKSVLYSVLP